MGWLGWSWRQSRREDVNVIQLALEGRTDLLKSIFGESTKPEPQRVPMTSEGFKAFVAANNQRYDKAERRGKG